MYRQPPNTPAVGYTRCPLPPKPNTPAVGVHSSPKPLASYSCGAHAEPTGRHDSLCEAHNSFNVCHTSHSCARVHCPLHLTSPLRYTPYPQPASPHTPTLGYTTASHSSHSCSRVLCPLYLTLLLKGTLPAAPAPHTHAVGYTACCISHPCSRVHCPQHLILLL